MTRTAEALDGLLVAGVAHAGPLVLRTPALAVPRGREVAGDLTIETLPDAPPARRHLRLAGDPGAIELRFPIFAPEVAGVPGAFAEAGPGVAVVHAPLAAEDRARLAAAKPELVVLGNARVLFGESAPFVTAIRELRATVGAGPVLWAPRVALPHRLPLLAYLGVDLVDATEALWRARDGQFLDATLGPEATTGAGSPIVCASCPPGEPDLASHALHALRDELARVRAAARGGRLRELVEARLTSEPTLAELLRYADAELGAGLEQRHPVVGSGLRGYVLRESHRRPEVQRFRTRLLARYRPPASKTCLLVLPCSRTKPYRSSRSHRRFQRALEGLPNLERVHVVSVTSPLGVVPRELEDTYPARHYDIPVTGDWDEAEREAVRAGLRHLLGAGSYAHVVVHLDPAEYGFLADIAPSASGAVWSALDHRTTSSPDLDALRSAVRGAVEAASPVEGGPLAVVREELAQVAAFQFGVEASARLFAAPVRLAGRPWFQRLTDGAGTDLATWRDVRGLFQLTVAGAQRMLPAHALEVEVDPKVELAGDLFAPGVARADPAIRTGDAVSLVRAGELLAVGEAALPGPLMTQLGRGLAVNVRHRARGAVRATPPIAT